MGEVCRMLGVPIDQLGNPRKGKVSQQLMGDFLDGIHNAVSRIYVPLMLSKSLSAALTAPSHP